MQRDPVTAFTLLGTVQEAEGTNREANAGVLPYFCDSLLKDIVNTSCFTDEEVEGLRGLGLFRAM